MQNKLPALSSARSLRAFLLLTRVHARMRFYLGDHVAARQLMEAGLETVRGKTYLAQQVEVPGFVMDAIAVISRIWVIRADFGAALEVFARYEHLTIAVKVRQSKRFEVAKLYVRMKQALQEGTEAQCKEALTKAAALAKNMAGDFLDLVALDRIAAYICLKQQWFSKAIVWAQRLQVADIGPPLFENYLTGFYVELTAHAATRDWDILHAAIRRTEYHLDTRNRWSEYDRLLIAYFKRVAKKPEQLPVATLEFREQVSMQMSKPYVALRHSFFDFVGLIEAAIGSNG